MTITIHDVMIQGSQEWFDARCGLLTASEMKLILTPTLKVASNEKERAHLYELLAQRITGHVEPSYVGNDMLRGMEDEIDAREKYAANYADLETVGFITSDRWGFTIGYSPDGLVGDDGLIEIKSRRQKFQIETLINHTVSDEHLIQVQTGLLVSERKWLDYVSYSAGLPMVVVRVLPDPEIQAAIVAAATTFEIRLAEKLKAFKASMAQRRYIATERRIEQEMYA
jgi:hypothetical protein